MPTVPKGKHFFVFLVIFYKTVVCPCFHSLTEYGFEIVVTAGAWEYNIPLVYAN